MNKTDFEKRNFKKINEMSRDENLQKLSKKWFLNSFNYEYPYHFRWLGFPIIQYPQDIVALQEIIWKTKPELIIETGIAHGGSIIFSASLLELLGKGEVIGVDVKIKKKNRISIEKHPFSKRIKMIEGSSISKKVIKQVSQFAKDKKRVMIILDSNHTHKHVLRELQAYSSLVTKGNYLVVLDTVIEDMPKGIFTNRPWDKGNNPKSAVQEFLRKNSRFKVDKMLEKKLLISVAPGGYLKCVKN